LTDATATVVDAAAAVRSRAVSAVELVESALAAIDARNEPLNAFVCLDADGARAAAREIDARVAAGDDPGPLAGVPFGVKDLDDCVGMPTSKGSRWYHGGPAATEDALHVARLRAAGAVPVGKTAAPEFGTWAFTASPALGVTRNPWDPARTPGGSSGGSSAAVAAGMVPFATSSDGGGSTRTPAGFTGLVGMKASYGRVPDIDADRYSQTACAGCLATTVTDAARLLDVMAGPHNRDRVSLPPPGVVYEDAIESLDVRGLRAVWATDLGDAPVLDPDVEKLTRDAAFALVDAAELTWVERDVMFPGHIDVWSKEGAVERFVNLPDGLWPERGDELDPYVRPAFAAAEHLVLPKVGRVLTRRHEIEQGLAALFDDVDVVLTPMAAVPAFRAEGPMPTTLLGQRVHAAAAVPFAMLANMYGSPAISVPAGLHPEGVPVGLHIWGPRHRDDVVLRLARLYEQARPWPRHAPSSSADKRATSTAVEPTSPVASNAAAAGLRAGGRRGSRARRS
jgi:aspartyl-tRNA(Asn)/glutamyl-tRNA(Gln) amidotransferase subunit A